MIALSTSWKSGESDTGKELLESLDGLDISGIELEYRISEALFQQMKQPLNTSGLKVVSVHNFFPIPAFMPAYEGSGDLFLLSSPDKEERNRAVRWTQKTIEHAAELGAAAVVLHCGKVEMKHEMDMLCHFFKTGRIHSADAQAFIGRKLKQRDALKPDFLNCLISSLDRLLPIAEKQGILLGLENRYHYHELPTLEDFEFVFAKFKGGSLGYWHDTGHAHINEGLTVVPAGALLKTYSDKLIGVHLHDAIGLEDHLAPGSGEIDFKNITSYLNANTIKVLELRPGTSQSEVCRGLCFVHHKIMSRNLS